MLGDLNTYLSYVFPISTSKRWENAIIHISHIKNKLLKAKQEGCHKEIN